MEDTSAKSPRVVVKVLVDIAKRVAEMNAEAKKRGITTLNNPVQADIEIVIKIIQGTEMITEDMIVVTVMDTIKMTVMVTIAVMIVEVMNEGLTNMTGVVVVMAAIILTLERLAVRL